MNRRGLSASMKSGGKNSRSKQVEIRLRKLLRRLPGRSRVCRQVDGPLRLTGIAEDASILLLRQDKIGDVLVSIPVIRTLRRYLPEAKVDVVLGSKNFALEPALRRYAGRCWRYSKRPFDIIRLLAALRRRRYDVVVDLMDNPSTTSALLLRILKPPIAIGLAGENAEVYTHLVPLPDRSSVHIVERIAQLLLPFGIDPSQEDLMLEYPLTREEKQRAEAAMGGSEVALRLGVNISGHSRTRYWGRDNFIALIREIAQRYPELDIRVFAAPDYRDELAAICRATDAKPAPTVHSFHEFAALLHTCDLLFTPDTSVVHLAAAWQTPLAALFVHVNRSLLPWTPYRSPHIALTTESPEISSIPVADAAAALTSLLQTHFSSFTSDRI